MRKLLLPLCFVLIFSQSESQIIGRFYYNKYWELTKKDSCYYFRVSVFDTTHLSFAGEVRDFTVKGKLVMVGTYKGGIKNGLFTQYYDSGQIESEGEFQNDKRVGNWKYFYENGNLMQEVNFIENDFFVNSFFDQNGKKILENGTGDWRYSYDEYRSPRIIIEGHFANGKKDGDWICHFESGEKIYEEKFKDGKLKRGVLYRDQNSPEKKEINQQYQDNDFSNKLLPHYKYNMIESFKYRKPLTKKDYPFLNFLPNYHDPKDTTGSQNLIYTVVEEQAHPKGGLESMMKIITENLKFPAVPRNMGIQGTVFLQFIVEKDGTIQNIEIIKGIHPECDQEAIRVLKLTSPWEPGIQSGKPVRCRFVLPIKFRSAR